MSTAQPQPGDHVISTDKINALESSPALVSFQKVTSGDIQYGNVHLNDSVPFPHENLLTLSVVSHCVIFLIQTVVL